MTSEVISEPDGPRFGPYILTAVLGRGGMGVVYRAFDTVKGRTVALKVLIPELAADRAFQDRFRRESKRAARLSEPHIIPIHDYGQIDGRLFIDMRLVEGIDLAALLDRDGPMPPPAAAWIMAQVAAALDAAHAGGLVHRDVKPSNVLITGQGKSMPFAYLIDFGIARLISSASMSTSSTVGTAAYMAPERFTGSPGDRHADVYSLACVLFECLTGRQPFSGEMVAVMWAQLNAVPPAPSTLRPGLPPAVDEVVARGLAKDPAHRFGSAGELAEAILAATTDLGAVSVPVPGADQAHDQRNPPTVQDSVPVSGSVPVGDGSVPAGGSVPVGGSVPAGDSGPARPDIDVPLWDSDPDGRARTVLRAIVSDPARGVAALSSVQAMSTALKELLPGRSRETKVLVAAAEEGLAEALSYHVARGMDSATVRDKVARSFARHTGFRPAACQWAVDELAAVLGLDSAGARPVK
jgi:serine/threonine-protein kinase